jgi:hypothetical protein
MCLGNLSPIAPTSRRRPTLDVQPPCQPHHLSDRRRGGRSSPRSSPSTRLAPPEHLRVSILVSHAFGGGGPSACMSARKFSKPRCQRTQHLGLLRTLHQRRQYGDQGADLPTIDEPFAAIIFCTARLGSEEISLIRKLHFPYQLYSRLSPFGPAPTDHPGPTRSALNNDRS